MRGLRAAVLAVSVVTLSTACTVSQPPGRGAVDPSQATRPTPAPRPPARISITPADGTKNVAPRAHVVVESSGGTLRSVAVSGSTGRRLPGTTNTARTRWVSTTALAYKQVYRVRARAVNATGRTTEARAGFHSAWPRATVYPAISPLNYRRVGVGMPVVVYFRHPVADPKAVQARLQVTSAPRQVGAWHWFNNNTEAHWRPRTYWRANSRVAVVANIFGADLGDGYWGRANRTIHFFVGERHVSVANSITHRMHVYRGTKMVANFPVSMGKEAKGRWSHSGVHVVSARNKIKHMDSSTFGLALDAGGYRAVVKYATRISNNGEFVHGAPWSEKQQGRSNTSHGCINLSLKRAKWFYGFSQIGDVVEVIGTPVRLTPADGPIFDWTVPWKTWVH